MTEILDMSRFIEAKSDQLNSDDLIGTDRTIKITKVTGSDGDQPVSIHYEGDQGKPFKPCKTIRRVLVGIWGKYAQEYVGRSLTLYRDDRVTFGGLEVGGIRISHASHLDKDTVVVVMKSKGKKVGIKVLPLVATATKPDKAAAGVAALIADLQAAGAGKKAEVILTSAEVVKQREWLAAKRPELAAQVDACVAALQAADDDPFDAPAATAPQEDGGAAVSSSQPAHQPEGRDDSQRGEHDPIRETADRLIADARDGVVRSAIDQGHYDALPDEMKAEVDAAGRGEG